MDEQPVLPAGSSSSTAQSSQNPASRPAAPADPEVLSRREQSLIDGILSNESLTEDLDDEDAQEVIDWSIDIARRSVQQTAGMEEPRAERMLSERMYTTRKMMRSVRRLVIEDDLLDEKTRSDLMNQISTYTLEVYGEAAANGPARAHAPSEPMRQSDSGAGGKVAQLRRALEPRRTRNDPRSPSSDVPDA